MTDGDNTHADGEIPADAICSAEGCGHRYDAHSCAWNADVCNVCDPGYFPSKAWHRFTAVKLAGGAYTPDQERGKYEEAMRAASLPSGTERSEAPHES